MGTLYVYRIERRPAYHYNWGFSEEILVQIFVYLYNGIIGASLTQNRGNFGQWFGPATPNIWELNP